ncbi:hypothetical protein HYH03_016686 [Edaphochlamys debaryana]|uniref:Uncharacterized protein n=1 Tax=Edaphochlamys debaryana TaxID=47281 RepID=A0A835XLQ4_9CHLO|nr:hypothetical protein HYH03_016686 [Edaphochlamys debaryana]|eukprot:KAG2484551.1 hypothetical protein HYH03_016686 [Edaphochlamys debaryana]
MLDSGMVVETPEQFRPLLAKLSSGAAIRVMAWGSSVVATHAGCYTEAGRQASDEAGGFGFLELAQTSFIIDARGYPPEFCEAGKEVGWGTLFMRDLNASWPAAGPDHLFANGGRSAASLAALLAGCYESSVPDPVDLILLENLGASGNPTSLEQARLHLRVVTTLLRLAAVRSPHAARPTVIMFNSAFVVNTNDHARLDCLHRSSCATECAPGAAGFEHQLTKTWGTPWKQKKIAETYGINLISVGDLLIRGMELGDFPSQGVAACEFLSTFMKDHIHPNQLGKRLFADLLWTALQRAQAALGERGSKVDEYKGRGGDQEEEGDKGEDPKRRSGGTRGRSLAIPSRPIFPSGHAVFVKRCYMQGELARPDLAHGTAAQGLPPRYLPVVRAEGWALVHHDANQRSRLRPGLVAAAPGSLLQLQVDTRLPGATGPTALELSYLASYEGWGEAEISCLAGCECEVTASSTCVVQVRTAPGRGGRAFKLLGLVVRAVADPEGAGRGGKGWVDDDEEEEEEQGGDTDEEEGRER